MATQSRMHREEIKAALRIKFGSLSAFEAAKGLPGRSVRDVLRGRTIGRTADAIAAELGKPVHDLFPSKSPKGDASTNPDGAHRLNQGAE